MENATIVIDRAFEGPPGSGHGGYTCGLLAAHLPADAEVTLRAPVPLATPLELVAGDDGVALHVGPGAIVEGVSTWLDAKTPRPPAFSEALAATAAFPGLQ